MVNIAAFQAIDLGSLSSQCIVFWCFPDGSVVKDLPANARDSGSIPKLGRSPGVGNGNPFQYSCLENSMDIGAWRPTVLGVSKNWTRLISHTHTLWGLCGISIRQE